MKKLPYGITLLLAIVLVGCNLPGTREQETQSPDAVFTQAAQTVAAELTRVSLLASPTSPIPNIPTNTLTPIPSNTPVPSATNTPIPCNLATWDPATIDVTVPDYTLMVPNQVFSKTWRIRNAGTCPWNSSYLLIFDHGDGIGVTTGYTQQLTAGVVNSGQTVDLTVNLKAPAANGTYSGYWRLRAPGGVVFGITPAGGTFVVIIKVPAATSHSVTISSNATPGENGTARGDGNVTTAELITGDSSTNFGLQLFLAFDISGIPGNATITEVKFDLSNSTVFGNPFSYLGCLKVYSVNYVVPPAPTSGDFVFGSAPGSEDHSWCSAVDITTPLADNDFRVALQAKVGTARLRYRLQFNTQTNSDNNADAVGFSQVKLIVTYTTP